MCEICWLGNILQRIGLLVETFQFWSLFWSPDIIIRFMWLIHWGYLKSTVYPDSIRYFPEFKYAVERHTSNNLDIPTTVNSAAVLICNLVVEYGGWHDTLNMYSMALICTIHYNSNTKENLDCFSGSNFSNFLLSFQDIKNTLIYFTLFSSLITFSSVVYMLLWKRLESTFNVKFQSWLPCIFEKHFLFK